MLRLLSISVAFLILFSQPIFGQAEFEASYFWPLKLPKQFSSGFGDTRPGRFHMGIDLRTNGQEGEKVYAPEDGYVWRLKTSYSGYGKALYIRGISGRTYVFGHLQRYNVEIGTYLQKQQIASRRYFQDIQVETGALPVKRGEFIARSGQTGAGAPHLHFEVRDNNDRPTNPLYYKVDVNDKTAPTFQAVWLAGLDDSTLFEGGTREIGLRPVYDKKTGWYTIPEIPTVSGRLAVKAAAEDYIGKGSFSLGPSLIRLFIDGRLVHEIDYDRIDFSENIFSLLDRDTDPAKNEYKRVFNLYRKPGNRLSNYRSETGNDGTFADTADGYHAVVIEASDPFGNTAKLEFTFFYYAAGEILAPFNRAEFTDSSATFQFNGENGRDLFDSVSLHISGEETGSDSLAIALSPEVEIGDHSLTLKGRLNPKFGYRMQFLKEEQPLPSYYFSTQGFTPQGQNAVDTTQAAISDNGLLFSAIVTYQGINWLQAEIVTDAGSERRFYRKVGDRSFSLYYAPGDSVNKIEAIITRGPIGFLPDTARFDIHRISSGAGSATELRPGVVLALGANDLFDDQLVSVRDSVLPSPRTGYFIKDPILLGPENCAFADWGDLQIAIPEGTGPADKIGLYVYGEDKGWLWAGGTYDSVTRILHSDLGGAGLLAVIADTAAPVITGLNLEENGRVKSDRPTVNFILDDELSGIENDLNFDVSIDDRWITPEYDPERKAFTSKPHWSLTGGRHVLRIKVTDRCGNAVSLTRNFMVGARTGP